MCTTAINKITTPMLSLLKQLAGMDVQNDKIVFETTTSQKAFKVFLYNLDLINLIEGEGRAEQSEKALKSIKSIVSLSLLTLIDILNKPDTVIDKTAMDDVTAKSYQDAVAILAQHDFFDIKNDLILARSIICM